MPLGWTARDPLLFGGGQANLYLYAGADPVGQRDPTGLLCVGGSAYSVFGGGGQLCITDEGMSLCAEVGLGFGTDAGVGLGDLAESGTSVLAKANAKLGPIGVEVGAELDSSGCLSGDKTPLGDLNADGASRRASTPTSRSTRATTCSRRQGDDPGQDRRQGLRPARLLATRSRSPRRGGPGGSPRRTRRCGCGRPPRPA